LKKVIPIFFLLSIISSICYSQSLWELGGEYQHPIGKGASDNIAGIRTENYRNKSSWSIGLTYNFASKSYSEYKGFGLYAGYRYAFGIKTKGNIFAGLRAAFMFTNFAGKERASGVSFFPSAEAGYHFIFRNKWFASPALGYGYIIKMTKEYNSLQEDEGGRIIPSISAGYRF
jgi:hypothetical protein